MNFKLSIIHTSLYEDTSGNSLRNRFGVDVSPDDIIKVNLSEIRFNHLTILN